LFVANLPFSVTDEELLEIFENLNAKSAHVVRTPSNRSRGYGFVEFDQEEDQLKAKDAKDDFEVEGATGSRRISVRVALQEPVKKESKNENEQEESTGDSPKK